MEYYHKPVMLEEVLNYLCPSPEKTYVDCTIGGGGHAIAILKRVKCTVIGIDCDNEAIISAKKNLEKFDVQLIRGNFANLQEILDKYKIKADGFLFDLGASQYQLYKAERGFSYRKDGPLDMRFDRRQELKAADIVNTYDKDWLREIITKCEERYARRIALAICRARDKEKIEKTKQLGEVIYKAIPPKRKRKHHPARKTFQALRIEVNNELYNLSEGLRAAVENVLLGGKVLCISYHSGGDRIVKGIFKRFGKEKIIYPSETEIKANPRARSAKLRVLEK